MKKILFALTVSLTWIVAFSQNVGVGTNTPVEKLDVAGNIKTTGEIKPNGTAGQAGQVLTANGNGTMQWSRVSSSGDNPNGNGGWGDCSVYNIDSFRIGLNANPEPGAYFGNSVAISGNYAVAGAPYEDVSGVLNTGSATIFKFNAATGQWDRVQKLTNPSPGANDYFGYDVAMFGDYIIVGAFGDVESGIVNCGSATIFKRNNTTDVWESQGKIVNPTPATDNFGVSVAISNDYAMVAANTDDEAGFTDNGSVTVLKRNIATGIWENLGKLLDPVPTNGANFGFSVSLSGDYVIVGAPFDDYIVGSAGSATIFKRNGFGAWALQNKLNDNFPAASDRLGTSVAINGDYAVVGIPFDDNGGLTDNGAAIIYKRNTVSGTWENHGRLTSSSPSNAASFGSSISLSADYLLVGAFGDDIVGADNGAATIFKRMETVWYPHQQFTNPIHSGVDNQFGGATAIDANRFIIASSRIFSTGAIFFGTVK